MKQKHKTSGSQKQTHSRQQNPQDKAPQRPSQRQPYRTSPRPPKPKGFKANFFGWHACEQAYLNPQRQIHAVFITDKCETEFTELFHRGEKAGLKRPEIQIVSRELFDVSFPKGTTHQGIAIQAGPLPEMSVQDLCVLARNDQKRKTKKQIILVLDQVTDPHNVGAILRSACGLGAIGVVMQSKHAPTLEGALAKIACGAVDHIPVAQETNLSRAVETLQQDGFAIVGMDEHAQMPFSDLSKLDRCVLIMGAEGAGMRRLIREKCDHLVALPTHLPIASLNVSNAAAIGLYAILHS